MCRTLDVAFLYVRWSLSWLFHHSSLIRRQSPKPEKRGLGGTVALQKHIVSVLCFTHVLAD